MHTKAEKFYINCPFSEKETCKALGGRWDWLAKSWYIPAGVNHSRFSKWLKIDQRQDKAAIKKSRPNLDRLIVASNMAALINPKDVARLMDLNISQAMQLLEEYEGPNSRRIGTTRYWERDALLDWLQVSGL